MKTILSLKLFLMLSSISLIVASCTKDSMSLPVGSNSPNPGKSQIAHIVDMGSVDGVHRLMRLILKKQEITVISSPNASVTIGNTISFDIYSTVDGWIPSGVYSFSNTAQPQSNTFISGSLLSDSSSGTPQGLTAGLVHVTLIGYDYDFTFEGTVSGNVTFTGHYSGPVSYTDVEEK